MWPVDVSRPSASASVPARTAVAVSSRGMRTRSTATPAIGPRNSIGRNCTPIAAPRARPLPVRSRTSSDWATIWKNVPTLEMPWPTRKRRTFGTPIDARCPDAPRARSSPTGPEARRSSAQALASLAVELVERQRQLRRAGGHRTGRSARGSAGRALPAGGVDRQQLVQVVGGRRRGRWCRGRLGAAGSRSASPPRRPCRRPARTPTSARGCSRRSRATGSGRPRRGGTS